MGIEWDVYLEGEARRFRWLRTPTGITAKVLSDDALILKPELKQRREPLGCTQDWKSSVHQAALFLDLRNEDPSESYEKRADAMRY